ncbi:MAG: hypothetical protein A2161_21735 [Candidatus Schekmanbacteria bacterium RBG_13_48_7]|uniref:DUF2283 domain-containing protein n=1 Tax=Candidatus Schekmanbacteria bacterium RBG_13_48_7 TaxID=1817878 RepID=A0A1F7RQ56_9BACT|nr:MAG: hypothetical protein A2161_21735 [Candidatus Schekmanbacteria bacterium RBG_13_48_7]
METIKILEGKPSLTWKYDEEADVLYISVGKPKSAIGIDIGDGLVVRYDEKKREVIDLTIIGFRARILESIYQQQGRIIE